VGARFEFYATDNRGFLNPLTWGIGGTSHPDSFTWNDDLIDTDYIFNTTQGESLVIDGGTGIVNASQGYATDTGVGWSGTYTATEGVVTVRHGIIIDVDWD